MLPVSSQSRSSSVQIINGRQTQNTEYRIIYQLVAKKEGTYTISPAEMDCDGDKYETDAITIAVAAGQTASTDKDFFMRLSSNKSAVYEGEPFVVTLKYYAKRRPESIEALDLGDASGIWRQDLKPNRQTYSTVMESVNGVRYYSIVLREEVCFAQRSGTVRLEPYYASLVFSQNIFNRFRKETYSNPLEIKIKPIPGDDAANFNGLVGNFSVTGELSKTDVEIGEAIDLKITVEGQGNMQALGSIDLKFPNDFDQFDPEIKEKTTLSAAGSKGYIEYNYVLIPTHHGSYEIPGYTFSYFDLKDRQIKTTSTGNFNISVKKPAGYIDVEEAPIKVEEQDIHYIEEGEADLFTEDDFLVGKWTYVGGLFSPLCLAVFFVLFRRKKENLSDEDKLKLEQKKAVRIAQVEVARAKAEIATGENKMALKIMQDTLNNFFKLKLNVGLSDLSQRHITEKLQAHTVDAETINEFNRVWNAIEMAQYAPIPESNMIQTAEDVEKLIINLDKKL